MTSKQRIEIPERVAAKVLFLSDRTCCVCRTPRRPVQIHHLDEDPSNCVEENLVVLCLECHRDTQLRGGFDRKLDAQQLILYRSDWHSIVDRKRHGPEAAPDQGSGTWVSGIRQIRLQGKPVRLSYVQMTERDDEKRYSFTAEYPEIIPNEATSASEINLCITACVVKALQRFRAVAFSRYDDKRLMLQKVPGPDASRVWDDMSMSFDVVLFSEELLVLEFRLVSYLGLAAHPDHSTITLNFLLQPSATPLELHDIFNPHNRYLDFVSEFCITELHGWPRSSGGPSTKKNDVWILRGAAPHLHNFEKFLLTPTGLRILFDPYQVSCYAEGRREVFIPRSALEKYLKESFNRLIGSSANN